MITRDALATDTQKQYKMEVSCLFSGSKEELERRVELAQQASSKQD